MSTTKVSNSYVSNNPDILVATKTVSGAVYQEVVSGLLNFPFDYVAATYPNATTEVYTYKTGGSGGTTQGTITVVYTDSTKASISTVTRS